MVTWPQPPAAQRRETEVQRGGASSKATQPFWRGQAQNTSLSCLPRGQGPARPSPGPSVLMSLASLPDCAWLLGSLSGGGFQGHQSPWSEREKPGCGKTPVPTPGPTPWLFPSGTWKRWPAAWMLGPGITVAMEPRSGSVFRPRVHVRLRANDKCHSRVRNCPTTGSLSLDESLRAPPGAVYMLPGMVSSLSGQPCELPACSGLVSPLSPSSLLSSLAFVLQEVTSALGILSMLLNSWRSRPGSSVVSGCGSHTRLQPHLTGKR